MRTRKEIEKELKTMRYGSLYEPEMQRKIIIELLLDIRDKE